MTLIAMCSTRPDDPDSIEKFGDVITVLLTPEAADAAGLRAHTPSETEKKRFIMQYLTDDELEAKMIRRRQVALDYPYKVVNTDDTIPRTVALSSVRADISARTPAEQDFLRNREAVTDLIFPERTFFEKPEPGAGAGDVKGGG